MQQCTYADALIILNGSTFAATKTTRRDTMTLPGSGRTSKLDSRQDLMPTFNLVCFFEADLFMDLSLSPRRYAMG